VYFHFDMIEPIEEYLMKNLLSKLKTNRRKHGSSRGQSLVELALVLMLLLFMVVAIVEYGFLLNQYLNIMDAGREAARQASLGDPFNENGNLDMGFFTDVDALVENFMDPLTLDPANDDVVISFFSVDGLDAVRFPDDDGWSRNGISVSQLTTADVEGRLVASAPASGVLLIEIFYHYWQALNLPVFSNVIPNPIPLYTFAIMPLSAAEPTPTPMGP
jgi:hypothetical protein